MLNILLKKLDDKIFIIAFLALVGATISFWFSYTYPQAMNENMGVLLVFAERLLDGGKIGPDIYEVNPPLSILLYVPVIWIKDFIGFDIHLASFVYISFCFILSTLFVTLLLKTQTKSPYETLLIVSVYVLAHLFVTVNDYGERDQFISFGLMPLCLLIYLKTKNIEISKILSFLVTIFGIVFILIKPHYGLLPAVLFMHRAWKRRSLLSPIKDMDFIIMSLGTLLYLIVLLTVFKDYTFDLLPEITSIYVHNMVLYKGTLYVLPPVILTLVLIMMGLTWVNKRLTQNAEYLYIFGILTGLSLIAFVTQTKGIFYQLIPAAIFFIITIALYLFYTLLPFIKEKRAALLALILPIFFTTTLIYKINFEFPDRQKIQELPFAQWFKTHCPSERQCSAYIFHESVDGIFASFLYTDTIYASRFASHWFLPATMNTLGRAERNLPPQVLTLEQAKKFEQRFGILVGEDFQNFKPDFVAIIHVPYTLDFDDPDSELIDFDFVEHYSQFPTFKEEWSYYKYIGTETVNRRHYFKGTQLDYDRLMIYDLYVRKQDK